jgi:hypothetical protein
MTLSSTTVAHSFAGNGSTTSFSYTFRCYTDAEIKVILVVDSTGAGTTKTLTTHYSVSKDSDYDGGTVTMVTAPASGETLWLIANPSHTQSTDLVASGSFNAETLEARLDRIQLQLNDVVGELARCLKIPEYESGSTYTTVAQNNVDRAGNYVKYDSSGNLTSAAS